MNFTSISQIPAVDTSSPLTTTESSSSSKQPSPTQGILKGGLQYHTVTSAASEIVPLKKSLSFKTAVEHSSLNDPEAVLIATTSSSNITRADKDVIDLSEAIQQSAVALADQKASELRDTQDALTYVKKNPISLLLETQKSLNEWHAIITDQAAKAKKYALWTTYRTELLKGNKKLQASLEEAGQSIDTQWTLQEIHDDWNLTKEEPWAQKAPAYDELKVTIAPLVAQRRQIQKEMAEAKATIHSFAQDLKEGEQNRLQQKAERHAQAAPKTNEYEPDDVFLPDRRIIDRNKYDIGNVEHHEDGTSTIVDMTGRRYDYPQRMPSTDSSCTIS